jgi:hypothetical protein
VTPIYWDDYKIAATSCKRVKRNVVDCKLHVTLWETAEDDPNSYTAKESCSWPLRVRGFARHRESIYQPGTEGGDFSTIECNGWYGDDGGDDDPASGGSCSTNYSGACLDPNASDYDCEGGSGDGPLYVRGPVNVVGTDVFGLDRDGDGVGCE